MQAFSSCGVWALEHAGSVVLAHELSSCGTQTSLAAVRRLSRRAACGLWHLSSLTRDRTCVPCIGRQILNHWTTGKPREAVLPLVFVCVLDARPGLGVSSLVCPLGLGTADCMALCPDGPCGCCSLAKSCPTLCDPMDCRPPGSSVLCYLPEFAQIRVH